MKTRKDIIAKLSKRDFDKLSFVEKIELISARYYEKQKITYEEYVILLATNDEVWFIYKDKEYQVEHDLKHVAMCITRYEGKIGILEYHEKFSSVIELLDKFKIEGKRIRDIWEAVTY